MSEFLNELAYAGSPYVGKANLTNMNPDFMSSFDQMAHEYYSQTGKELKVDDAWRSEEAQAEGYRRKPNLVAPPGHSKHPKGEAMDLNPEQANQLAQMGLLDKYGFTRPMLGQGASGKNEPWHIEMRDLEKETSARAAEVKPDFMSELNAVGNFSQELSSIGQPKPSQTPATAPQAAPGAMPQVQPGGAAMGAQGQPEKPYGFENPPPKTPKLGEVVHKVLTGGFGDWESAKQHMKKYFVDKEGAANFEKDFNAAMASPEAKIWGAIDPMVGIVTPVGKVAQIAEQVAGKGVGLAPKAGELNALEKVVGLEKFDPKEMQDLMKTAKGFGIDLTVPELTNSPTLKALWTRLAKTPGPQSEKLATYLEEIRNPQVEEAIRRELGNISPTSLTPFQAGGVARGAAQSIESGIQATRKGVTQPLYKAAFENPQPVDTSDILEKLSGQLAKYPEGHPSRAALQQVERMLTKDAEANAQNIVAQGGVAGPVEAKRIPVTDLETLHQTKTGIDQLLEKAKADKSIDNDTRRLLMGVKSRLQGQMEKDNPLYGVAQKTFRLLSKPLNDFRFGNPNIAPRDPHVKTVVKRLADLAEPDIEKAIDIVFTGSRPQQIVKTKAYFDKAYPGTWDAMVRTKLEHTLNNVRDTVAQREGNVGGVFKRTVFKDAQDRNMWQAAMGPEKFRRFESFMDVLDKTRRIIYTNSETAFQIEAGKILESGGIEEKLRNIPTSKGGVLKWIAGKFDRLQRPEFASKLADAMLDPENAIELTRLRRLPDNPRKAFATAQWIDNAVFKVGSQQDQVSKKVQNIDDELKFRGQ